MPYSIGASGKLCANYISAAGGIRSSEVGIAYIEIDDKSIIIDRASAQVTTCSIR